jgi:hypothetical protein
LPSTILNRSPEIEPECLSKRRALINTGRVKGDVTFNGVFLTGTAEGLSPSGMFAIRPRKLMDEIPYS